MHCHFGHKVINLQTLPMDRVSVWFRTNTTSINLQPEVILKPSQHNKGLAESPRTVNGELLCFWSKMFKFVIGINSVKIISNAKLRSTLTTKGPNKTYRTSVDELQQKTETWWGCLLSKLSRSNSLHCAVFRRSSEIVGVPKERWELRTSCTKYYAVRRLP